MRAPAALTVGRTAAPGGFVAQVAAAYSETGGSWASGPERVYGVLAERLLDALPGGVSGATVLDLGAGTGAASRAAIAAGAASVVAVDLAAGMLVHDAVHRPPAVLGDAVALPFRTGSFDVVVAAFSLNHVAAPHVALAEAVRVLRPGGTLIASAYATDDEHPVKAAVEASCRNAGWRPDAWVDELAQQISPLLATVERARGWVERAGIAGASCEHWDVEIPGLTIDDLVEWRLGMPSFAHFVATRSAAQRARLVASASSRLGADPPSLTRRIVVIRTARSAEDGVDEAAR